MKILTKLNIIVNMSVIVSSSFKKLNYILTGIKQTLKKHKKEKKYQSLIIKLNYKRILPIRVKNKIKLFFAKIINKLIKII